MPKGHYVTKSHKFIVDSPFTVDSQGLYLDEIDRHIKEIL